MDIWNAGMVVLELIEGRIVSSSNAREIVEGWKEIWGPEFYEVMVKMIAL